MGWQESIFLTLSCLNFYEGNPDANLARSCDMDVEFTTALIAIQQMIIRVICSILVSLLLAGSNYPCCYNIKDRGFVILSQTHLVRAEIMETPLLTTKLFSPPLRQEMVLRPRLIARLNAGLNRKLTLISAPAGFGKTTLLSEWISTLVLQNGADMGVKKDPRIQGLQPKTCKGVAWLSLDERDNDSRRFWTYVVSALQMITPELGSTTLRLLESQPVVPPLSLTSSPHRVEKEVSHEPRPRKAIETDRTEAALTALINEIAAAQQDGGNHPLILVLDDYHTIKEEAIHAGFTFLIDHLPPAGGLHLVIAGRTDPPLPLSRLRSRRQMNELDETDLRFTPEEATTLLNQMMGLGLSAKDVADLEARTEGWIVGLQMAAQSIMGRSQGMIDSARSLNTDQPTSTTTEFIRSFTGSHRDVVDYLTDEVLLQQPPEVQTFLLQTSILDRLCGPLCDAVCTRGKSEIQTPEAMGLPAQDKLEYLETANLFIVPLDSERRWFRYHQLFSELLRQRLNRRHPNLAPTLHLQASEWYDKEGLIDQAVSHALRAGDHEHTANLIQQHVDYAFKRGEFKLVMGWLEALPEELVRSRPLLCVAYAYSLADDNLDQADRWIEQAQTLLAARPQDADLSVIDPDINNMAIRHVSVYHASTARSRGESSNKVIERIQIAQGLIPESDHSNRGILALQLAIEQLNSGDEQASERNLTEALRLGEISGSQYITLIATYALTIITRRRGQLRETAALCRNTLASTVKPTERSGRRLPLSGLISIMLGNVLVEWNDLSGAEHFLPKGLELAQLESSLVEEIRLVGGLALARLRIAQGDVDGLSGLVDWITQSDRWSKEQVDTIRTYVWLVRSHREPQYLQSVLRLVGERHLEPVEAKWDWEIWDKLTWARAIITQGRATPIDRDQPELQPVLDFLNAQYQIVETYGWIELMINTRIVQALAYQVQMMEDESLKALERALILALPEGYARIFLDEGLPMARLLYQAVQRGIMPEYAGKLLATFEATTTERAGATVGPATTKIREPSSIIEPLTPREIEVLQLIARGLSNREIAQKLSISLSTVKRHNANIYGKLIVNNRTQAVIRGRDLGLLQSEHTG
jgi:LuxR family maltose regulon positive regulatory protein